MIDSLKRRILGNEMLSPFVKDIKFFMKTRRKAPSGTAKKFPTVVQMPITYNCNSKCVMCNIWKMDYSNEMSVEEFSKFLSDPIFSKVEHLGINGGEPSLVKELDQFAFEILKLPNLKSLNIISHGFNRKQLFPFLESVYAKCKEKNIPFHISISLDGYGEVHDRVRGLKVFKLTSLSIKDIHENMNKYCDTFDIGCTVIKQNVDDLIELDVYAQKHDYNIKYRMGIENKRIESDKLKDQYSLLYDGLLQSAKEFFHSRINTANNLYDKFKYFAIYYFLVAKKKERLLGCYWQEEGMTMDSRGDLYYCAVASDKIGSLRETDGKSIFFSDKNIAYRKSIIDNNCN
ncbi:MAG: radical SAM protein, partial [Bacteroidia bacterium]|nr:radical SAM protein [Bacteroidia bacterium]